MQAQRLPRYLGLRSHRSFSTSTTSTLPLRTNAPRSLSRKSPIQTRSIFGFFKPSASAKPETFTATSSFQRPTQSTPLYGPDDLFHPYDTSPIPALRSKSAFIKSLAPCPVCLTSELAENDGDVRKARAASKKVEHTCPDCGFPTHCSEEHWQEDKANHAEYCDRLREINEDEHDLRSGRVLEEFEMPGAQDYESAISFSNWDTLFYTRNFKSIDSERSRRHVSKLLTYPMTMAAVLHQTGPFGISSGRLTKEGVRSMTALHTSVHPPIGSAASPDTRNAKIPIRIFVLGARAESSLPPHIYEQINMLFPFTQFQIYFVGPQAALPIKPEAGTKIHSETNDNVDAETAQQGSSESQSEPKSNSHIYSPSTPHQSSETQGRGRMDTTDYGVPSYTLGVNPTLQLTTLQAPYETVHEQFGPFDPYTDVFFAFCPGFGFPSPTVPGTLQAQTEWSTVLKDVLDTKCALFLTGFSPRDVERDVKSLDTVDGVKGEYDILLEPGENGFSSLKWEAGDFDPRVLVRVNWGVWGIRGKRYEVGKTSTADEEEKK